MGVKLHKLSGDTPDSMGNQIYWFFCPGCQRRHPVAVPFWSWNHSMDKPTFRPSLRVNGNDAAMRCHSTISDGEIQFSSDCWHPLAGQTVEIPDWQNQ